MSDCPALDTLRNVQALIAKALQEDEEKAVTPAECPSDQAVIRVACAAGAKVHHREDGMWVVLDQENTPLWWACFGSEAHAARAYCMQNKIPT